MSRTENSPPAARAPRSPGPLPTGPLTILFTDIEGSTHLLRQLGDLYPGILAEHFRILRQALRAHEGVEINTEGDAIFAVFRRASDALQACIAAQRDLAAVEVPGGLRLRVRMGLHTGEVEAHDGELVGLAIHEAARLVAAGHGGQVLCSASTAAELAMAGPSPAVSDLQLADLGVYTLRGFEDSMRMFQVLAAGLDENFPPLRLVPAAAHNLPSIRTRFFGRERELEDLEILLRSKPLVTVLGAGGTGKTRLTFEVVRRTADRFADGAVVVLLASAPEGRLIESVATALGVREEATSTLQDTVLSALARRECLLLLDNCEHMVEEVAHLADTLLDAAPRVRILATSRRALEVAGEHLVRLTPLQGPTAVDLFVERATAVRPEFTATKSELEVVERICRYVDGLPLAIELAAARVRSLPLTALESGIRESIGMLSAGPRTLEARQRTVGELVEWSYRLLEEGQKTALRRLSVFRGGFDMAAFVGVCTGAPLQPGDAADLLDALAAHSLIDLDESGRYRVLVVIREVGARLLVESWEGDAVRDAHAAWFEGLAGAARGARHLFQRPVEWGEALEAEAENFRAACEWALVRGHANRAARLGVELCLHWGYTGRPSEAREMLQRLPTEGAEPGVQLELALALSKVYGEPDFRRAAAREALSMATAVGDRRRESECWVCLSELEEQSGNYAESCRCGDLAIEAAAGLEPPYRAAALIAKGSPTYGRGEADEADRLCGEGLAIAIEAGCPLLEAMSRRVLGLSALARRDFDVAETHFTQAHEFYARIDQPAGTSAQLSNLGNIHWNTGDYAAAHRYYEAALLPAQRAGNRHQQAIVMANLGLVLTQLGNHDEGVAVLRETISLTAEIGARNMTRRLLLDLGKLLWLRAELDGTQRAMEEGLAITIEMGGNPADVPDGLAILAAVAAERRDWAETRRLAAAVLATEGGERSEDARALLARVAAETGDAIAARAHALAVLEILLQSDPENGAYALGQVGVAIGNGIGRRLARLCRQTAAARSVWLPPTLAASLQEMLGPDGPGADPVPDPRQELLDIAAELTA
ncbi:MAG: tetratricopeptide repeat protein [Candidatus Dormibacteria bacterium]